MIQLVVKVFLKMILEITAIHFQSIIENLSFLRAKSALYYQYLNLKSIHFNSRTLKLFACQLDLLLLIILIYLSFLHRQFEFHQINLLFLFMHPKYRIHFINFIHYHFHLTIQKNYKYHYLIFFYFCLELFFCLFLFSNFLLYFLMNYEKHEDLFFLEYLLNDFLILS